MHYLCLIYVLRSANYLSNVPTYVKTWKLRAVTHDTCSKHISGWKVTVSTHCHNKVSPMQLSGSGSFLGTLHKMMQHKST